MSPKVPNVKPRLVEGPEEYEKLKELILYVAKKCEGDENYGAKKLNKLLYYADFGAYLELGHPVTGAQYQHLKEGPAPISLLGAKTALLEDGAITIEEREISPDPEIRPQVRLIPQREANTDLFSPEELGFVDLIIEQYRDMSGAAISRLSHKEPGWMATSLGENIPYPTAWLAPMDSEPTEEQIQAVRELERDFG